MVLEAELFLSSFLRPPRNYDLTIKSTSGFVPVVTGLGWGTLSW